MALVSRIHLNSLVSIQIKNEKAYQSIATGFLIGILEKKGERLEDKLYRIFLVTNRHVFEDKSRVFLRFNKKGGGFVTFPIELVVNNQPTWLTHKDKTVDLALLSVPPKALEKNNVNWVFLSEEFFAESSDFEKIGIELGDQLFIIGFPLGMDGVKENYPIVKLGAIARFDKEIIRNKKAFIIDASIFPGNSGGPVLLKPELASLKGTKAVNSVYLLGVVSSYLPYKEILYSHQTAPPSYAGVSVENSGLAFVVPMDFTKEIYEQWIKSKKPLQETERGIEKRAKQ